MKNSLNIIVLLAILFVACLTINAEAWAEGVYVWKVIANDKEVERGKWIKE